MTILELLSFVIFMLLVGVCLRFIYLNNLEDKNELAHKEALRKLFREYIEDLVSDENNKPNS